MNSIKMESLLDSVNVTLPKDSTLQYEIEKETIQNSFNATFSASFEINVSMKIENSDILSLNQEVTRNLWNLKKYLDLYIAHLQGSVSESEFNEQAVQFIKEKNKLSIDQIKICSIYLKSVLPDIEVDDIASLLNVDFMEIAKIIEEKKKYDN